MEQENQEQQKQKQEQQVTPQQQQIQEILQSVESLKQQNQLLQQQLQQRNSPDKQQEVEEEAAEVEQTMKQILGMDTATEKVSKKGIDELTNAELVEAMSMAVEQVVSNTKTQATKEVNSTIQQVNKRIEAIQGVVMNLAVQSDIKACKDKFPDFDSHAKDIQAELQQTPGLSIEKAYLLVKASKASRMPANRNTSTEKPSDALTEAVEEQDDNEEQIVERPNKRKVETTSINRTASFRQAVEEAANKVISARLRKGVQ
jgi:hypothetical protein